MSTRSTFRLRGKSARDDAGTEAVKNKFRRASLAAVLGTARNRPSGGKPGGSIVNDAGTMHSEDYGITDYRVIPRWFFATQPFLEPHDKVKMSIGTLYVKVVEARGLMSADLSGRSDPYVKLCLTGRYLSHGQEWSESLRLRAKTKMIKYTLDPVWGEEFTLPVRRAGAVLKVEVWDWDRSSPDDPLGHFQVNIGEELLSQQPMDMWYVLEAPRGMTVPTAATTGRKQSGSTQEHEGEVQLSHSRHESLDSNNNHLDGSGDDDYTDETGALPVSPAGTDTSLRGEGEGLGFAKRGSGKSKGVGKKATAAVTDHCHGSDAEASSCEVCINLRRQSFGEVRLKIWFQFDEFAEMCSHLWPEEPLNPAATQFSPNQLYRKAMLLKEMAQPYMDFMQDADRIVSWLQPRRSLVWLIIMVAMLLVPHLLIIAINFALIRIVVSAYGKHRGDDHDHGTAPPDQALETLSTPVTAAGHSFFSGQEAGRRTSYPGASGATGMQGSSLIAAFATPTSSPGGVSGGTGVGNDYGGAGASAGGGGELSNAGSPDGELVRRKRSSSKASMRLESFSRALGMGPRAKREHGRRSSLAGYEGSSSHHSSAGLLAPSRGVMNSTSAPARIMEESSGNATRSAPPTTLNSPAIGGFVPKSLSFAASPTRTPPPGSPVPPGAAARPNGTSAASWVSGEVNVAAAAVATGGKKIKKLLPTRVTRDPEMHKLDVRLGSTKKIPLLLNEVGKRLLEKSGPVLQSKVEKFGMDLIKVRELFHPLHTKHMMLMVSALFLHMLFQLWLYQTGRFNLYLLLVCVGQFSNKLYKRWGKAFVMAIKEAARCRRIRLALSNSSSLSSFSDTAAAATAVASGLPSAPPSPVHLSLSSAARNASTPYKHPDFAPPGTTPACDPHPSPLPQGRSAPSPYFDFSPNRGRRGTLGSIASGSRRESVSTVVGGDSSHPSGNTLSPPGSIHGVAGGGGGMAGFRPRARSVPVVHGGGSGGDKDVGTTSPNRLGFFPWGNKTNRRMGNRGGGGRGGGSGGHAAGEAAPASHSGGAAVTPAAIAEVPRASGGGRAPGAVMTGRGGSLPSPAMPPDYQNLPSQQQHRKHRKARRRVRWGRVVSVSLVIACGVAAGVAALAGSTTGESTAEAAAAVWRSVEAFVGRAFGEEMVETWLRAGQELAEWAWTRVGPARAAEVVP